MKGPADRQWWAIESSGTNSRNLNTLAVDLARSVLTGSPDVLDAGCGTGEFGEMVYREFGISPDGIDIVQHPSMSTSYRQFQCTDLDIIPAPSAYYDLICAIEVIEHIKCPRDFVLRLSSWLKPGGHLLISSPNIRSLVSSCSLLVTGMFRDFKDGRGQYPAHISPISPVDLRRMFIEAGLVVDVVRYSGHGRTPFAKYNWPSVLGRLWPALFSDNYFVAGRRAQSN